MYVRSTSASNASGFLRFSRLDPTNLQPLTEERGDWIPFVLTLVFHGPKAAMIS
jgi:hypothetical protein